MYVVGLTGGIACGKSEVSRRLQAKGLPIVDADIISRKLVEPGQPLLAEIAETFGDGILHSDGSLDRGRLGRLVFDDYDLLQQLNALMHPAIWKECLRCLGELREQCSAAVLVVPLLYEHNGDAFVDTVWVVACSEALQLQRLQERDHLTEAQAYARIKTQMPIDKKIERADHVILNEGTLEDLQREVDIALEILHEQMSSAAV